MHRHVMAWIGMVLMACSAFAQDYDPGNQDMKLLETRAGGNQFYVNTDTIESNGAKLSFKVVGYSTEQKEEGGYSASSNSIDCKQGIYNRAPEERVDSKGNTENRQDGDPLPVSNTLRNDGGSLYRTLKDLCEEYSELEEDEIKW